MTIEEFIAWLKTMSITGLYAGYIPKNSTKVIGVYARPNTSDARGYKPTYGIRGLTLLIHWTKGMYETEKAALSLHKKLNRAHFATTDHNGWIECSGYPVDVGKDENGVCEWSLDLTLYIKTNPSK